jgi:hypothetical protein
MNHPTQSFTNAIRLYPEFKERFVEFYAEMAKRLNANSHLPNVNVSLGSNGASATLQALDQVFDVSFHFIIADGIPWGLLRVTLPGEGKEPIQLFHLLFDNLGNVKSTPDASANLHSLTSTEFVKTFTNRVVFEYFAVLWSSVK